MATNDNCTMRKPHTVTTTCTTKDEWRNMSLMDKWKSSYRGDYVDNTTSQWAQAFSIIYFWFISTTELYSFIYYIIPVYLQDTSDIFQCTFKFVVTIVYIESALNWICTRKNTCFVDKAQFSPENDNNPAVHVTVNSDCSDLETNSNKNGLTWTYCNICDMNQPPRAHHCKICNKCVLKRDHHCFMTGVCIGFNNQKYFTILNFYIAGASIGGLIFTYLYMSWKFSPMTSSFWDFFLPVTIYNWWYKSLELQYVFMMFHMYTLWWTAGVAIGFFVMQIHAICQGKTTHEVKKGSRLRITATMADNFTSVFGPKWWLNFIFPAATKQKGDGIHWGQVKQY